MINAALNGDLNNVGFIVDSTFGVNVPTSCPNVPPEVLIPRNTWTDGNAYDAQACKLAGMFVENFKQFEAEVSDEFKAAGPRIC
jgi:phosphoenolpyruvate carboxykinase (ATP)